MLAWDDADFETESGAPIVADTTPSRVATMPFASA
jgi:hypothetical protein